MPPVARPASRRPPGLGGQGFGCRVLAHDIREDPRAIALGVEYVGKERLLQEADIVSLHCPLLPSTHHMISADRRAAQRSAWCCSRSESYPGHGAGISAWHRVCVCRCAGTACVPVTHVN